MSFEIIEDLTTRNKKSVEYFGLNLIVPKRTSYIATNSFGDVIAFESLPKLEEGQTVNLFWKTLPYEYTEIVGRIKFKGTWKDSLLEIKDEF